jgi:hypothetical protein
MAQTFISGGKNPYLPLSIYIPDGEPKLFDGRVYLYGSKDYYGGEYCCHKYHAYSAPADNLEEWTDHGPILASTNEYLDEGIADGVDWSDGLLWAPDVIKRGDLYYLYFCLSDGSEGVAESPYPYGPFTNARRIMNLRTMPIFRQVPVSAITIGNVGIVGFGGEPFTEYADKVREGAEDKFVMSMCNANGGEGYLTTLEAHQEGGYEASATSFSPDLEEQCVGTALKFLNK